MNSYVINLDRHSERLTKFRQNKCAQEFERIKAIDKNDLAKVGLPELFFNVEIIENKIKRKITLGEIACTLSHISCWHKIATNDELSDKDYAVIAEDDIVLSDNFDVVIHNLLFKINEENIELELIILHKLELYGFSRKIEKGNEYQLINNISFQDVDNDGSALYLIRKDKAIELVNLLKTTKPFWLADHFSTFCPNKIAILFPYLGYIDDPKSSDLEEDRAIARKAAGI